MAPGCYFVMKAVGTEKACEELYNILNGCTDRGFNHLYYLDKNIKAEGDAYRLYVEGYCDWSVHYSMCGNDDTGESSLAMEAKRLNLNIEIYSNNVGDGFEEHYIFLKNGYQVIDGFIDYDEVTWFRDRYPTIEEFNMAQGTNYTEDDFEDFNGECCRHIEGGYGDWEFVI